MIFKNSRGQRFHKSIAGTYPIDNGDPQCDLDYDDLTETEQSEVLWEDRMVDMALEREDRKYC